MEWTQQVAFIYPYICIDAIIIIKDKEKKVSGQEVVDLRGVKKIGGVDGLI